ncbi:MAG TPA: DNA gyrase inhibitor YacG [Planctomycetota bacterium]|nr:DNA gyrase inhibitor YacG [Planctomycetota bacterium]
MAKKKTDPTPPVDGPKKKGRCPRCGADFEYVNVTQHPSFPFCSKRCRDIDLGNWLQGKYVIPGKEIAKPDEAFQPTQPEDADDGT